MNRMYFSNTGISTSHNTACFLNAGEKIAYRALLKPVAPGSLRWRFRFSNMIDSTWDDGSVTRAETPGGRFRVEAAAAGTADARGSVLSLRDLTWRGERMPFAEPGEWLISDPVMLDVPYDGYVVFEWHIEASGDRTVLPATPDHQALTYVSRDGASFVREDQVCLPDAFEADRYIAKRMVFMGDSITQGVRTRPDFYEQWAARIAMGIERDVAVWNIGLGFGRAEDAALCGTWLGKAAGADIVNLCFGINDLLHGTRSDVSLLRDLNTVAAGLRRRNPGIRIVMFTVPPFDLTGRDEIMRRRVNDAIRENGCGADAVFDIARILARSESDDSEALFGAHPDGRGGAAAAGEYLTAFWPACRRRLMNA